MKQKPPHARVSPIEISVGTATVSIDELPTYCPRCRGNAVPVPLGRGILFRDFDGSPDEAIIDVPMGCPLCKSAYVAEYVTEDQADYTLNSTFPTILPGIEVSEDLQKISPRFAAVFDQATAAEHARLDEVAGAGYRRALEFLVKDYLISKSPADKEKYLRIPLGSCIKNHIGDATIRELADRANIMATDFVHYEAYGHGDLRDLVSLIDLVRAWIQLQAETEAVRVRLDLPTLESPF